MSLIKDVFLKDIKYYKKNKEKRGYGFLVEEEIQCELLIEKITMEQKRKGAEILSKKYLDPLLILSNYLKDKWRNKIGRYGLTKSELNKKKEEFNRLNLLEKKVIQEFSDIGIEPEVENYVSKMTQAPFSWLTTNGKDYSTYLKNDKNTSDIKIPKINIIMNPKKNELGTSDFGFKDKSGKNKQKIEEFTYRHELGHVFDYLKQFVETGEPNLTDTIAALKQRKFKDVADSEGKANAYALDDLDRFTRRELLKNSSISRKTLDRDKTALEIDSAVENNPSSSNNRKQKIRKVSQLYRAGTEKHSKTIKDTLNSIEKERKHLKELSEENTVFNY